MDGIFQYTGASELVPEVNQAHGRRNGPVHLGMFVAGLGQLLAAASMAGH